MRMRILLSLALLTALAFPSAAEAACSNPAGVEGEIIVNSTFKVPAYCDDTNWIAMTGGEPSSGASTIVVPTGLIGYWPLDGDATDAIGSSDGSLLGDTAFTALQVNDGVTLDGSGDYINLGSDSSIDNISGEMSICLWASKDSGGGYQTLLGKSTDGYNGWDFYWAGGNGFGFLTPRNGYRERTSGVTQSTLHHLCATWDGTDGASGIILYLDGAVYTGTGGGDLGADLDDAANNLFIGGGSGTSFPGDIDDVRLYNRVISPTEITEIYNCGMAGDCGSAGSVDLSTQIVPTGLVGHWRFDETSGTTAYDSSATGVDLTYSGSLNPAAHSFYGKAGRAIDAYYNDTYRGSVGSSSVPLSIKQSDQITMAAWVKIAADNVGVEGVIRLPGLVEWNLKFSDIRFLFEPKGWTTSQIAWGPTIPLDEWTHIAVSYDYNLAPNTTPVWFVNGVQKPSYGWVTSTPTGPFNPTSNTDIGIATSNYPGAIDDVRIYDRILNEDEVRQIYNARDGIRYNETMRKYEYFDGNKFVSLTPDWKEVDEGEIFTPYPDLSCPNVGDVCSDGSVYAGLSPDGNKPMYTTPADEAGTYFWNNGNGAGTYTDTMSPDCNENGPGSVITTCITGELNTANIIATDADGSTGGIQPNQAAQQCADLTFGGNSDWYLPALEELWVLYNDRVAIGGFSTGFYWSSSEDQTFNARRINFGAGAPNNTNKNTAYNVRCVRRADNSLAGTSGLIGHWKMDETSGTTAVDSSGNGNNATIGPNLDPTTDSMKGAVGTALHLKNKDPSVNNSGYNSVINVPDLLTDTDNVTLAAWVYPERTANTAYMRLFGGNSNWIAIINSNNTLSYALSGSPTLVSSAIFENGKWIHLALTYDATTKEQKIFVNGTEDVSQTDPSTNFSTFFTVISHTFNGYEGGLDDVRLYDRVLNASEIQQLYQMGSPIGSSTALPQGCPNIGDVCDDGTYYAGLSPDGNIPMYAAAEDESVAQWRSYGNSRPTSTTDGDGNTLLLYAFGPVEHPHAYNCFDKVAHGASDWYWPAQNEMLNIYNGGNPIGGVIANGTEYWTSNQHDSNSARSIRFNTGYIANTGKNGNFRTRCVRKGPAPRCANPYGLEGQMIYNSTHDVVQFCDGARWIAVGK